MFELQKMELYVTHIGYEASESNCSSFLTFSPSVPWVGVVVGVEVGAGVGERDDAKTYL